MVPPVQKDIFTAQATYVIAGGFGGQGKSVARWMSTRGARNLLILSRQGMNTEGATSFVEEMQSKGVCVKAPSCDITKATSLRTALEEAASTLPAIKGCIQ